METIIQRIKALIVYEFGERGENSFAKKIGIPQVSLNNYTGGRRKLSLEVIEAVIQAFPNISAEWLLRGEGSMIRETSPVLPSHAGQVQLDEGLLESQHEKIRLLETENNMLKGENSVLREQVGLGARKADGL